jgi:hypothetical protein
MFEIESIENKKRLETGIEPGRDCYGAGPV